jgi:hypothetical protein
MNQRVVLPLLIVMLAALAGVLWTVYGGAPGELAGELELGPARDPGPSVALETSLPSGSRSLPTPARADQDLSTTVTLPLELDFELIEAQAKLAAEGAPPMNSDKTARLRGSMHGADGRGLLGQVEFVAGPNRGRVLETDAQGSFGTNDLYPGLSLVALRAPGTPGAEREVLLRQEREAQLNVGFGRPAIVRGLVKDENNVPIPTAKVTMDGQETLTDAEGHFYFSRMTSGKVPLYVSKPGFASLRRMHAVTAGMTTSSDKFTFTLAQAATLRVVVPERVGLGRPAELFVGGPLDGTGERSYPWHLKSPVSIQGGESIELEDLPAGRIRLQLFRPGALAEPAVIEEVLVAGSEKTVTFHLVPAQVLAGVVRTKGAPVQGALVQLEAPDVTSASVQALGGGFGRAKLEMDVLSQMPPALQRTLTGADGRFTFSAGEELSALRYLTARSSDGRMWAGRSVRPGEYEVELALTKPEGGRAGFRVETSTRFQALPVKFVVDGKPSFVMLPPGERLEIKDLPEGEWRFTARWGNDVILKDVPYHLTGFEELFVPLPKGAIEGQSKALQ